MKNLADTRTDPRSDGPDATALHNGVLFHYS